MASAKRLRSIDLLRGVAVLAVLLNHLPYSSELSPTRGATGNVSSFPGWLIVTLEYGRFGVHLFLVISGFCIHMQWARRGVDRVDFLAFWRRRLGRLYPPYFVALLLSLAGLFVLFGILGHQRSLGIAASFGYPSLRQLVVDVVLLVFLAQNLNGAYRRIGNAPFWSLALEEQLYMLYFPLLWLRRRLGWSATLMVCTGVTMVWRAIGLLMHSPPECWFIVGPSLWLEWTLGALAVEAYLGRVELPRWARSLIVAAALTAFAIAANHPSFTAKLPWARLIADTAFGLAFFVWINAIVARERPVSADAGTPWLARVGVWSYSLYLTHEPVLVAAKQLAFRLGLGTAGVVVLRLTIPLLLGYAFHLLIERRFLNAPSAPGVEQPPVRVSAV